MPEIRNLLTDYNGTFDPKYLEICLGYALKHNYEKEGNIEKYKDLRKKQFKLWMTLLTKGSDAVLGDFVDTVLIGETKENFEAGMRTVCYGDEYIPKWIKAAGSLHKRTGNKVYGEIDPDAIRVFREAKENGITTGIYSRSSHDMIEPYLNSKRVLGCFDVIAANEIIYDDSVIVGLKHNVHPGKDMFEEDMNNLGIDVNETVFIDDKDIEPLEQASLGIASPSSKDGFKEMCREHGIKTPEDWYEVGRILDLW